MTLEESFEGGTTKLSPSGFFNYVFNFDSDNKAILLNMFQYIIIALIPVIVLLKVIKEYIPEDDDKKDSIELVIEIVIQLGVLFIAMYLIDKIIKVVNNIWSSCFRFYKINISIKIYNKFMLLILTNSLSNK